MKSIFNFILNVNEQRETLGKNDIEHYIDTFFQNLIDNVHSSKMGFNIIREKRDKLRTFLQINPDIQNACRFPFYLEMICRLWESGDIGMNRLKINQFFYQILIYQCRSNYWRQHGPTQNTDQIVLNEYAQYIQLLEQFAYKLIESNEEISEIADLLDHHTLDTKQRNEFYNMITVELGFIRATDKSESVDGQYCFIQSAFKYYFSARHLAKNFDEAKMIDFIKSNKFNPTLEMIWVFLAGILIEQNNNNFLQTYIDLLLNEPQDLLYINQSHLILRCWSEALGSKMQALSNESKAVQDLEQNKLLRKDQYRKIHKIVEFWLDWWLHATETSIQDKKSEYISHFDYCNEFLEVISLNSIIFSCSSMQQILSYALSNLNLKTIKEIDEHAANHENVPSFILAIIKQSLTNNSNLNLNDNSNTAKKVSEIVLTTPQANPSFDLPADITILQSLVFNENIQQSQREEVNHALNALSSQDLKDYLPVISTGIVADDSLMKYIFQSTRIENIINACLMSKLTNEILLSVLIDKLLQDRKTITFQDNKLTLYTEEGCSLISIEKYGITPTDFIDKLEQTFIQKYGFTVGMVENFKKLSKSASEEFLEAVIQQDEIRIKEMLENPKINIDTQDAEGNTALHLLSKSHAYGLISFLLEKGINFKLRNDEGKTADEVSKPVIKEIIKEFDDQVLHTTKSLFKSQNDNSVTSIATSTSVVSLFK